MGWNRYLICIFIFLQGREFCWTLHCHLSWDFFNYYSCFGEDSSNPDFTVYILLLLHTNCFYIYIFWYFFALSPFPCPDFPAAKPWDLLSPVSGGLLYPNPTSSRGTFPPSLFPPGQAQCCKRCLETPRSLQPFAERQKKNQLKLKTTTSPSAAPCWGVQSMLCCCFPGELDSGLGQLLFTLCAGAAPCLSLLVRWVYFCIFFSFFL